MAGASGVLLLAQINGALSGRQNAQAAWTFAAIAVMGALSRMTANVSFQRLAERSHAILRNYVADRVIAADYRRLESTGAPAVQAALTEHSARVSELFANLPAILTNAVIVTGCVVYLALLSWSLFLLAVAGLLLGSLGYHFAHLRAIKHLRTASQEQVTLFRHFNALTDGAKELRLNWRERKTFANDFLKRSIEVVRHERSRGMSLFVAAGAWGNFLMYAFVGLVLFALTTDGPDRTYVMTGYALVFIYMIAPLDTLLQNIPRANLARVAAAQVDKLIAGLCSDPRADAYEDRATFTQLSLRSVMHHYYDEARGNVFTLGPVDLDFKPGQITFLVGGNGSGKTTLAKLIVGLYATERGTLLLDGKPIDAGARDEYRQVFAAVFSDFHLFDRLPTAHGVLVEARVRHLIAKLHLQHKVDVREGAFTTQALSQGQRKRLALIVAYLQDRPFLVFDEWAADQDPLFKKFFYEELLPELRNEGKCVLVITHDDRYFPLADRIVHMESGGIVSVVTREAVGEGAGLAVS
jgi:putative ATP-binding cassette transporter